MQPYDTHTLVDISPMDVGNYCLAGTGGGIKLLRLPGSAGRVQDEQFIKGSLWHLVSLHTEKNNSKRLRKVLGHQNSLNMP